MNNDSNKNTGPNTDDEIDLLALAKTVWDKRKTVFRIVGLFILLGLLVALLTPKEFTASSTFVPQTAEGSKAGGSLGGLASLAGINLGGAGSGSEIPPTLYPKIVSSVPFKLEMLKAPIQVEGVPKKTTYQEYYETYHNPGFLALVQKYTLGLPGVIIKTVKGAPKETIAAKDSIIRLTEDEVEHFKRLENQVSISFNDKEGFVELSVVMPDPLAAAQMTKHAEALLQREVIAYKIQNAREQLKFTEERYKEKKAEFEDIQKRLANFQDRNRNISTSVARNQLEKLQSEYNLAFSVYDELAKQLEQSKLQVSKDTPIFSVIQPVTVPAEKSAPKRPLILVIFTILGGVVALGVVFGGAYLSSVKEEWKNV